jgi:membrane protease YdiL (CAAX protease family)
LTAHNKLDIITLLHGLPVSFDITMKSPLLLPVLLSACLVAAFQVKAPRRLVSRSQRQSLPQVPRRYRDKDEETEEFVKSISATGKLEHVAMENTDLESGADFGTFRTVAVSQALVLAGVTAGTAIILVLSGHPIDMSTLHWNGSSHYMSFWDFQLTPLRFLEGIVAAVPTIFLSTHVEKSDHRDASHVNFSTMDMVMSLFGRRKDRKREEKPYIPETPMIHAYSLSVALAICTGISEEIIFRGILPAGMFHITQSVPMTLIGQCFVFSLGHLSPRASLGENKVICSLQAANGLWYGFVYLVGGADIMPCIIGHALYDIHVFMETWMSINDQLKYTEKAMLKKLSAQDEIEIRRIKQEAGPRLSTKALAHARRFFYAFDYEQQGGLSKSDVKRAASYAFLHDKIQPTDERVCILFDLILEDRIIHDNSFASMSHQERLSLPEFLMLLFLLKADPGQAAENVASS